jgi:hypothetical protein
MVRLHGNRQSLLAALSAHGAEQQLGLVLELLHGPAQTGGSAKGCDLPAAGRESRRNP